MNKPHDIKKKSPKNFWTQSMNICNQSSPKKKTSQVTHTPAAHRGLKTKRFSCLQQKALKRWCFLHTCPLVFRCLKNYGQLYNCFLKTKALFCSVSCFFADLWWIGALRSQASWGRVQKATAERPEVALPHWKMPQPQPNSSWLFWQSFFRQIESTIL